MNRARRSTSSWMRPAPRLQGARLTAWELEQYGVPYDIITDGSSGCLMRKGMVNKVFFGADRVAANGRRC